MTYRCESLLVEAYLNRMHLIVFATKRGDSLRLYVDCCELNEMTIKYPLPLIDGLLDQLYNAKVFSQLNIAMRYHPLRVAKESVSITTFRMLL